MNCTLCDAPMLPEDVALRRYRCKTCRTKQAIEWAAEEHAETLRKLAEIDGGWDDHWCETCQSRACNHSR